MKVSIEYMNARKDSLRAHGRTGGKSHAVKTDYAHMEYCPIRDIVNRAKGDIIDAIEQYRFDVCGDEWVHLCPF